LLQRKLNGEHYTVVAESVLYLCAVGTEWVDPEDPTVIAENELLGAAAAIEAAAKKLEQLRPRTKPKARMVAAATNNLCEAANSAVQGHASEEKLISSAKQVAASTAQLLVACKVKADQDSQSMKRLQVSTC
ncbi:hypothetical protein GOODEAATRI_032254, partial [Goodea atripinnis]